MTTMDDIQWIQTFSGQKFFPLSPRAEAVHLVDIAHALAMKCRYSGHCDRFYSVAEHSVHISRVLPTEFALWGLLHDAAEAYLPDVPRPIKPHLTGFAAIERSIMREVCVRFDLPEQEPAQVKWADTAILADELAQVMGPSPEPWKLPLPALGVDIKCWSPEVASLEFRMQFYKLTGNA